MGVSVKHRSTPMNRHMHSLSSLTQLKPADLHNWDARPLGGTVILFDMDTRLDVSEPLSDFEVDAFGRWLTSTWPEERCLIHAPVLSGKPRVPRPRGRRPEVVCTCAGVFQWRLFHAWMITRNSDTREANR
jgi:hypothetical protein